MKSITNEFILKKYLLRRIDEGQYTVSSHNIESDLVRYAREYWGKVTNPSTFSRAWRKLKEDGSIMNYKIITLDKESEGTWRLVKDTSNLQHRQFLPEVV